MTTAERDGTGVEGTGRDDLDAIGFGKRLRAARKMRGWKLTDLAERAGVGVRPLQRWEQGEHLPRTAVPRLAAALDVDPAYLLRGDPDEHAVITLELVLARVDALEATISAASNAAARAIEGMQSSLDAHLAIVEEQGRTLETISRRLARLERLERDELERLPPSDDD